MKRWMIGFVETICGRYSTTLGDTLQAASTEPEA